MRQLICNMNDFIALDKNIPFAEVPLDKIITGDNQECAYGDFVTISIKPICPGEKDFCYDVYACRTVGGKSYITKDWDEIKEWVKE